MSKEDPLKGWKRLPNGDIQFYNYVMSAVCPTPHHAALAIRYVRTQKQLDGLRSGKTKADQLQIGLNSQQCRHLADQLLHIAAILEKQTPAPPQNQLN